MCDEGAVQIPAGACVIKTKHGSETPIDSKDVGKQPNFSIDRSGCPDPEAFRSKP
jgi:hypothetical protein